MRRLTKGVIVGFTIFVLGICIVFGTVGFDKAYASSKWVLAGDKAYEGGNNFTEARYLKKIHKLPSETCNISKSIQMDIRNEFIRVKSSELRPLVRNLVQSFAEIEVQKQLEKLIIETAQPIIMKQESSIGSWIDEANRLYKLKDFVNTTSSAIALNLNNYLLVTISSKQVNLKEVINTSGKSAENQVLEDTKSAVINSVKDEKDKIVENIITMVTNSAIKEVVAKSSKTNMCIIQNDIEEVVKSMVAQSAKKLIEDELLQVVNQKAQENAFKEMMNINDALVYLSVQIDRLYGERLMKPVIYIYPTEKQVINLKFNENIAFTCTYPEYNDGWRVTAYPNGTLVDERTGKSYYCLYWEGLSGAKYDISSGFVVKGENTAKFLEEYLGKLGLTEREANEFIIYWLPIMKNNKYNLIHFATDEYIKNTPIEVNPKPDTLIRFLMVYKGLESPITIKPQEFIKPERKGSVLVEWGGTEIKNQ